MKFQRKCGKKRHRWKRKMTWPNVLNFFSIIWIMSRLNIVYVGAETRATIKLITSIETCDCVSLLNAQCSCSFLYCSFTSQIYSTSIYSIILIIYIWLFLVVVCACVCVRASQCSSVIVLGFMKLLFACLFFFCSSIEIITEFQRHTLSLPVLIIWQVVRRDRIHPTRALLVRIHPPAKKKLHSIDLPSF